MRHLFLGGMLASLLFAPVVLAQPSPCNDHAPKAPPIPHGPTLPAGDRQGGDTVLDAVPITEIPFAINGTTCGYGDDYDEVCPYADSTAPDVVYSYQPLVGVGVIIDLAGSAYDTKVYVYDENLELVACNDDYYADYTSRLYNIQLSSRVTYYIVIDGYGDGCGEYALEVREYVPCQVMCPPGAFLEGEPMLYDGYIDEHNGGCCGSENNELQVLPGRGNGTQILCARSGWHSGNRDTDWFVATIGASGVIEVRGDAEELTYLFEIGPLDCNTMGVLQDVMLGPCEEGVLTIVGEPYADVWVWAGPTTFDAPDGSSVYHYDYVLWFDGLAPASITGVPDEPLAVQWSLSAVKGLFE